MPRVATHQSDQANTTMSNSRALYGKRSACPSRNVMRRAFRRVSDARALRRFAGPGSNAETRAPRLASRNVRRPSPQPISSTRCCFQCAIRPRARNSRSWGSIAIATRPRQGGWLNSRLGTRCGRCQPSATIAVAAAGRLQYSSDRSCPRLMREAADGHRKSRCDYSSVRRSQGTRRVRPFVIHSETRLKRVKQR